FGQETVTWIDSICPRFQSNFDNAVDIEIGSNRMAFFTNPIGFVGFLAVDRVAIFIRKDSDGLGIEFVERTKGAHRDLTTVSDQYLFKHWFTTVRWGRVILIFSQGSSMVFWVAVTSSNRRSGRFKD